MLGAFSNAGLSATCHSSSPKYLRNQPGCRARERHEEERCSRRYSNTASWAWSPDISAPAGGWSPAIDSLSGPKVASLMVLVLARSVICAVSSEDWGTEVGVTFSAAAWVAGAAVSVSALPPLPSSSPPHTVRTARIANATAANRALRTRLGVRSACIPLCTPFGCRDASIVA